MFSQFVSCKYHGSQEEKTSVFLLQVPSGTRATSEKSGDACRPSTPPLVPFSPTLIRLSLPAFRLRPVRSLLAGNSFKFSWPSLSPTERRRDNSNEKHFCCCPFNFSSLVSVPRYRHPLRASDRDGSVPVFMCVFLGRWENAPT